MKSGCRLGEPRSEAELLPIVGAHQNDVRRLDEQGSQILAAALGYPAKNRFAARAVLAWDEAEPGPKVTSTPEGVTRSYGRHHRRRYNWSDAGNAHQSLAIFFTLADRLDLAGDGLDTLVKFLPICIEANNQIVHARRYLVYAIFQDRKKRIAQRMGTGANRYSLFDQEGADLIDRRRSRRDA